ncbi:hypothetical protein ACWF94_26565 [Streptomyces sp. NPDC055078]
MSEPFVRRICGEETPVSRSLVRIMFHLRPEEAKNPEGMERELRCLLEDHQDQRTHSALAWVLTDASKGEMWVSWAEAGQVMVQVRPDCPAVTGHGVQDEACGLFLDHPGGHSFELLDPEEEAFKASPEYAQITNLINSRLDS